MFIKFMGPPQCFPAMSSKGGSCRDFLFAFFEKAYLHGAVARASDTRARGPGFDTPSSLILSLLILLIPERQLTVVGVLLFYFHGKQQQSFRYPQLT